MGQEAFLLCVFLGTMPLRLDGISNWGELPKSRKKLKVERKHGKEAVAAVRQQVGGVSLLWR